MAIIIKKKDVNSYYADRRARHPLSVKRTSFPVATKSSKVKADSQAAGSTGAIGGSGSSVPPIGLRVPPMTGKRSFTNSLPPIVKRWTID